MGSYRYRSLIKALYTPVVSFNCGLFDVVVGAQQVNFKLLWYINPLVGFITSRLLSSILFYLLGSWVPSIILQLTLKSPAANSQSRTFSGG